MEFSRRNLIAAGATLAAASMTTKARAEWTQTSRYPDPAVMILDPSFARYRIFNAGVECLATGMRWSEGPVWFGAGRYLVWSDLPNNRLMKWEEETGEVSVFRRPSGYAGGNTHDRQGRLISCENLGRRVTRTEYDGSITVLADGFQGKRLNSPNDVVVKSDGTVWFTDPPFGISGNYEGRKAVSELPTNVYRLDPETKTLTVATGDIKGPNGLAFSPDEKILYVIEAGATPNRLIQAFDVAADGNLSNRRVAVDCGQGTADGMRVDVDGNLWCGWGMGSDDLDGVMIFNPAGKAIGRIKLPERAANLCFGGELRNRLFMAASQSLYSIYVGTQGAAGG